MKLTVATCQFPVDADIRRNLGCVLRQMAIAKRCGAHVAHFPECALSGYAGTDFASYEGFDWSLLEACARKVLEMARDLRLWVILGSTHRLMGRHKPHNSLYVITARWDLFDRYDKMFCAGDATGKSGDLAHYSPGTHFSEFSIAGVRCGALICHDYRYPELYREYKRRRVELMFHSYHAGHVAPVRLRAMREGVGLHLHRINNGSTLPEITMRAAMHAAASSNYMWISCSNSSARESCWPGFFVRPDGVVTGRLRLHTAGVLISTVDTKRRFYDSTAAWRDRAIRGVFHSGMMVQDKRSEDRAVL